MATEPAAPEESMSVESYLAQGGVLTSPLNVSPRYRGELMRLMASFVDSALAGAAGFADVINDAPGIKERIAAARIVLEKTDHAERVLAVMGSFGADASRYATHHPWAKRVARDADIGASRQGQDMRLSVFHYPLQGWTDAVVMNVLMGAASTIQLRELERVSYQPLAEAFRFIAPRERRHAELGVEGLRKILATPDTRSEVEASRSPIGRRALRRVSAMCARPASTPRNALASATRRTLICLRLGAQRLRTSYRSLESPRRSPTRERSFENGPPVRQRTAFTPPSIKAVTTFA